MDIQHMKCMTFFEQCDSNSFEIGWGDQWSAMYIGNCIMDKNIKFAFDFHFNETDSWSDGRMPEHT